MKAFEALADLDFMFFTYEVFCTSVVFVGFLVFIIIEFYFTFPMRLLCLWVASR